MKYLKQLNHIFVAINIGILFFFLGFSSFVKARFSIEKHIFLFILPILIFIVIFIIYKGVSKLHNAPIAIPDKNNSILLYYMNTPIVGLLLGFSLFLLDTAIFINSIEILFLFIFAFSLAFTVLY